MFYTGLDPRDMQPVYVPRDPAEKAMQRALMQYFMPQYRSLVIKALYKTGNEELIPKLLPPRKKEPAKDAGNKLKGQMRTGKTDNSANSTRGKKKK